MSFRHTFVTEFLYRFNSAEERYKIQDILKKYARAVYWQGHNNVGYFHGVITDLDSFQTKIQYQETLEELEKAGVRIKIVFE